MRVHDFTRTFGDFLLRHIYLRAGGDGRRAVRIDPYRAAVIITGQARPTRGDVRQVGAAFRALVEDDRGIYRLQADLEGESAFLIMPRRPDPLLASGGSMA